MFFDKVLVENNELRRVWRAGYGRMEEPGENTSFTNICTNLYKFIDSEDPNPKRRLSLRCSSVLVEGATRIYRQELNKLTEDLFELDRAINRHKRRWTDSKGDNLTDSSEMSSPFDTPEQMRRQILRHSDVSIQRPENETVASLKAPEMNHSFSCASKSTNSEQTSRNDVQNDQSAKKRKTVQRSTSSEYPSSLDLTTDGNSEEIMSDEQPYIGESDKLTKNKHAEFSDDQATSKTDQQTEKSSEENNSSKSPDTSKLTDNFDSVAESPDYPLDTPIAQADARNKFEELVTLRKKVITDLQSSISDTHSNRNEVKESDKGGVVVSPILNSTARKMLRKSRQGSKNTKKREMKKDQESQTVDDSFHPNGRERDRSSTESRSPGYLLIRDPKKLPRKFCVINDHTTY